MDSPILITRQIYSLRYDQEGIVLKAFLFPAKVKRNLGWPWGFTDTPGEAHSSFNEQIHIGSNFDMAQERAVHQWMEDARRALGRGDEEQSHGLGQMAAQRAEQLRLQAEVEARDRELEELRRMRREAMEMAVRPSLRTGDNCNAGDISRDAYERLLAQARANARRMRGED